MLLAEKALYYLRKIILILAFCWFWHTC